MKKFICLVLAGLMLACALGGCAEEKDKPKMALADVLAFADQARDLPLGFFAKYDYVVLGSSTAPLYYFELKEYDYTFSIGLGSDGLIESMMLSHSSGEEIYLFHKNPGILDPNATQYKEDAKSYDIEKFISKTSEK